jgi:hypothetical protein
MDQNRLENILKLNNVTLMPNSISVLIMNDFDEKNKKFSNIIVFSNFKIRVNKELTLDERNKIIKEFFEF